MDLFQIILLALIQGISEFLPISSSAHLILPSAVLGWDDQGLAFDVAVHVGSLLAVVTFFRQDIMQLINNWLLNLFKRPHDHQQARLAWWVILATIPAGFIGLIMDDWIELNLRSVLVIACTTIIFGLALAWFDYRGSKSKENLDMSLKQALIIGFAQALALIPGTSRSGITMTASLALGFTREAATRFSFLLSIPLITAAGLFKTKQMIEQGTATPWADIIWGVVLSGIAAYLCIKLFIDAIEKLGFLPFVWYRLLLGTLLIVFWFAG